MMCSIMSGWFKVSRLVLVSGVAILLFGAVSSANAQGLTYVDAIDTSYGGSANLFLPGGGTPTTAQLDPSTHQGVTGWGWRSYGHPTDGFNTIYESSGHDSPELRMGLSGLTASASYDVYVVYWSDSNNWNIRAGYNSPTLVPASPPLQVFDRTGDENNSAIAGSFASSAAWVVSPQNSLDTTGENDPVFFPVDIDPSPFSSILDGEEESSRRNMYMGYLGPITAGSQAGTTSSQIRVYLDDLPSTAGEQRSWIEGLAYVQRPGGLPLDQRVQVFTTGIVNRDTGNLTINNPTGVPFTVASYSISSTTGSLNAKNWLDQTHDLNALNDPNPWTLNSPANCSPWPSCAPAYNATLSEAEMPFVNGLTFAANGGTINLGNVWQRTPFEDVQVTLTLTNGANVVIIPTFEGTGITAGDFTGAGGTPDGEIDQLDYLALIGGLHVPYSLTAEAYRNGDITGNGVVDRNDVLAFRNVFEGANGSGSFAAMITRLSVPEPSTALLIALGFGFASVVGRRRRSSTFHDASGEDSPTMVVRSGRLVAVALALSAIFCGVTATRVFAQAVPVINWTVDTTNPFTAGTTIIMDPGTNHPKVTNIQNANIWANMPTAVDLVNGQELTMSGRITLTGIDTNEAGGFRWGFFNDNYDSETEPARAGDTAAWEGYLANNSAGAPNGRLEAKNPDWTDYYNRSHMSTFGGQTANFSGACNNGGTTAATGNPNPGCGNAVFNLASGGPNANFVDGTYEFDITVGRYGDEVTVSASLVSTDGGGNPIGDYNNDGTTDAADYTVWRDNLGTGFMLPNREPGREGNVNRDDYTSWKENYGSTGTAPTYSFFLGGGIDFEGRPPAGYDAEGVQVTPMPHLAYEFNRVSLFFGNVMAADMAQLEDVFVTPKDIQSLTLEVDLADNGATRIINNSSQNFDMIYYEITSDSGSLIEANWTSFDDAENMPVGVGWNEAGGSSDSVLSEINLTGDPRVFGTGGTFANLGDVFNPADPQDLRFFFIQSNGSTVRGIVDYIGGGSAATVVPEPGSLLLLSVGLAAFATWGRRRS